MELRINQMGHKLQELSLVEKKNQDYENKVVLATQEIERLNRVLRERNGELGELQERNRDFENRFPRMETDIKELRRRLDGELHQRSEMERELEAKNRQIAEMK